MGVELAGEIANDYPQKEVTIIHSREWLVDDKLKQKFLKKIHDVAASLNIKLVLGEKVKLDDLTVSRVTGVLLGKEERRGGKGDVISGNRKMRREARKRGAVRGISIFKCTLSPLTPYFLVTVNMYNFAVSCVHASIDSIV